MADIFEEVDEELKEENFKKLWDLKNQINNDIHFVRNGLAQNFQDFPSLIDDQEANLIDAEAK